MNAVSWANLGVALLVGILIPAGALLVNMRTTMLRQGDTIMLQGKQIEKLEETIEGLRNELHALRESIASNFADLKRTIEERTEKHVGSSRG